MTSVQRVPTILDQAEHRFPLSFESAIPRIRTLFKTATRLQWDPRTDIDWSQLDCAKYTDEQRFAARQYWSRRAWGEYGAISESPALQIRFCRQQHPVDMRLFFTIRSQEEARHAEVCYRMAAALGGYIEQPQGPAFEGSVATHGVRKLALDPDVPLAAIIAALVCAAEEIAFDVFVHLKDVTTDPVALAVIKAISRDEVRHCAFGWAYMDHIVPQLSAAELQGVEQAVINMIEKVEMNGYHSAWLAPDNPAARHEAEVDRLTWEAGLGSTIEELEKPVFIASIRRIRERMSGWGFTLPLFSHAKINGAF